jgi:cyclophilin family peptidyl-prolyl cis-trans isomerase
MSFISPNGGTIQYEHPPGTGSMVKSYRDIAEENQRRIRERMQQGTIAMCIAPSDRFTIKLNGVVHTSRKHPRFGYVIDLPIEQWNEKLDNIQIPIPGGKKGDYIQMQLVQVREETGTY